MNIAVNIHDSRIEDMIALIDEMILIIVEENAVLTQGLPASRSKQLSRKTELAGLFEQWVANISSQKVSITASNDALRLKFADRIKLLQTVMDENIIKLRAAIEASQRRIDAVMNAIRERMTDAAPYTANGRIGAVASPYMANIRA